MEINLLSLALRYAQIKSDLNHGGVFSEFEDVTIIDVLTDDLLRVIDESADTKKALTAMFFLGQGLKESPALGMTHCKQCAFHSIGSSYSLDGFDRGNDWTCTKANKIIEGFVEWREPEIPKWCPLKK